MRNKIWSSSEYEFGLPFWYSVFQISVSKWRPFGLQLLALSPYRMGVRYSLARQASTLRPTGLFLLSLSLPKFTSRFDFCNLSIPWGWPVWQTWQFMYRFVFSPVNQLWWVEGTGLGEQPFCYCYTSLLYFVVLDTVSYKKA